MSRTHTQMQKSEFRLFNVRVGTHGIVARERERTAKKKGLPFFFCLENSVLYCTDRLGLAIGDAGVKPVKLYAPAARDTSYDWTDELNVPYARLCRGANLHFLRASHAGLRLHVPTCLRSAPRRCWGRCDVRGVRENTRCKVVMPTHRSMRISRAHSFSWEFARDETISSCAPTISANILVVPHSCSDATVYCISPVQRSKNPLFFFFQIEKKTVL
jgi:hypothetical protein